jgi:hypothetical protein
MNKLSLLTLSLMMLSCSERVKEEHGSLIYVYIGLALLAPIGIFFFKNKSDDTTSTSTSEQSSESLDNNSSSDPNQVAKRGRGRPRKDSL